MVATKDAGRSGHRHMAIIDVPPAIVLNHPGGYVMAAEALGKKYASEGTKLIVVYCVSACVLILDIVPKENICFRPSAWIGYHSEHHITGPEPSHMLRWERGRDWINRGYNECR